MSECSIIFEGTREVVVKHVTTEVIRRLLLILQCRTDEELATILNVNKVVISGMRKGTSRLSKKHLCSAARRANLTLEKLCTKIEKLDALEQSSPRMQKMQANRISFITFCANNGYTLTDEERDSIYANGLLMPSLINKIFARNNTAHIDHMLASQDLLNDHEVKQLRFTNIPSIDELKDYDDEDEEEEALIATVSEETEDVVDQIIDHEQRVTCKVDDRPPQGISDAVQQYKNTKITTGMSIQDVGIVILQHALSFAQDHALQTVSIAKVRISIGSKIPDHDLRYDPNGSRITLIGDDIELCTLQIPAGYVFSP